MVLRSGLTFTKYNCFLNHEIKKEIKSEPFNFRWDLFFVLALKKDNRKSSKYRKK